MFEKMDLLEISLVSVASNPDALIEARDVGAVLHSSKAFGLDEPIEIIDPPMGVGPTIRGHRMVRILAEATPLWSECIKTFAVVLATELAKKAVERLTTALEQSKSER